MDKELFLVTLIVCIVGSIVCWTLGHFTSQNVEIALVGGIALANGVKRG